MSHCIINAFVSHPVGGDVEGNMKLIEEHCGWVYRYKPEAQPHAPYLLVLKFLDDNNPLDRERGTSFNREFFRSRFIDELWLFGNRISRGMWQEISWAREFGIPVIPMTSETQIELMREEIRVNDRFKLLVCGPNQICIGRYKGELEEDSRVVGIVADVNCRRHELWWGDIIALHPLHVPVESQKRLLC
jgi:hypothetical protein